MSYRIARPKFTDSVRTTLEVGKEAPVTCYREIDENTVAVPFTYAIEHRAPLCLAGKPAISDTIPATFVPREHQVPLIAALTERLRTHRIATLCAPTGAGKTSMSIVVANRVPGRKLILCPRSPLVPQWENEIKSILPGALVYADGPNMKADPAMLRIAEYVVVYYRRSEKFDREFLDNVSLLIVDELHECCNNTTVAAILNVSAAYMIGCTATPDQRKTYAIAKLFFGEDYVRAHMDRRCTFSIVDMMVQIDDAKYHRATENGKKMHYGRMERAIVADPVCEDRWVALIAGLVNTFKRKIIAITKYVAQAESLSARLNAIGVSADTYVGTKRTYDGNAAVLLGTVRKVSTGFDQQSSGVAYDKRFDTAIIMQSICVKKASDGFMQMIGRAMRTTERMPCVIWALYHGKYSSTFLNHCEAAKKFLTKEGGFTIKENSIRGVVPDAEFHTLDPDVVLAAAAAAAAEQSD